MKKLVLIIILLSVYNLAQDRSDPGIELPEFVITGVERVTLPTVTKPKAVLISILSEDFIRPAYSPEELQISDLSNPVKKDLSLFNENQFTKGRILAGMGFWIAPAAELYYGNKSENILYSGRLWGINERAYITNAGVNSAGAELNSSIFISHNSTFLPGTEFKLGGFYLREAYKFFASDNGGARRNLHQGNINFGAANLQNKAVKFDFNVSDHLSYLNDVDLTENVLSTEGFFEMQIKDFALGGNALYKNQNLKNNPGSKSNYGFFGIAPFMALKTRDVINLNFGFKYATSDTNSFFAPFITGSMKFNKYFSFLAEYNPSADLLTISDLVSRNRYLKISSRNNFFLKENMNLAFAVKYEYETYFEVDAGVKLNDYKYYPYFSDKRENGKFEVLLSDANRYSAFVNFLFHSGPYGNFYGSVSLQSIKNEQGKKIPYEPAFNSEFYYGYTFPNDLSIKCGLDVSSASLTDSLNTNKIPAYIGLSLNAEYKLVNGLNLFTEIHNILNRKNYNWRGYRERPFDVLFGIIYKW